MRRARESGSSTSAAHVALALLCACSGSLTPERPIACPPGDGGVPGPGPRAVDVMFLIDVSSEMTDALGAEHRTVERECMGAADSESGGVIALPDVYAGIAYFSDFPLEPYGLDVAPDAFRIVDDAPFVGHREPGPAPWEWDRPIVNGGDRPASTVQALSILSCGPVDRYSTPLECSPGRVPGGCWRPEAARVIVVFSNSPIHGVPDDTLPYDRRLGARWSDVRERLRATGTTVIFMDNTPPLEQFDRVLADLGQTTRDHLVTPITGSDIEISPGNAACDAVRARVREIADGM